MQTHISVQSSVIAEVAYLSADSALDIVVTSGARYRNLEVPAQVVDDLLAADSKGVFFNRCIRPCYRCTKLAHHRRRSALSDHR